MWKSEIYGRVMNNFAIEEYNSHGFYALAGSSFHVQFQWTLRQLSVVLLQTPQGKDNSTAEPSVCLLLYLLLSDWQGHIYCQQAEVAHVLLLWHALSAHALYVYPKSTQTPKISKFGIQMKTQFSKNYRYRCKPHSTINMLFNDVKILRLVADRNLSTKRWYSTPEDMHRLLEGVQFSCIPLTYLCIFS